MTQTEITMPENKVTQDYIIGKLRASIDTIIKAVYNDIPSITYNDGKLRIYGKKKGNVVAVVCEIIDKK